MKNSRKILSIALGGVMVPMGLVTTLEHVEGQEPSHPLSSVGRIGDAPSSIGDTDRITGQELLGEDVRPEIFRENTVTPPFDQSYNNSFYPASYSQGEAAGYASPTALGSPASGSMYESVVGCCPPSVTGYAAGGSKLSGLGWAEVDALLWWGPFSRTPPLAVGGPRGSLNPTTVVAGGEQAPLGGSLLPGIRANLGFWLDDSETMGIGGRFTTLLTSGTSDTFASDGAVTLGMPFFNASTGVPATYLVALDTGLNGADTGSISVSNETSFLQADAYGKFLLARTRAARADLLCGYTFVRLDNSVGVFARSVDGITGGIPDGTVETFSDQFGTKNTFHGGNLGFSTDISRGAWTFSTLSKVSLGNMQQTGTVVGTGENLQGNQGFYARNQGTQTRNVFTFLPEAGAKIRYHVTPNTMFNVGYSFLFFPDVALASGLIDTNIDINPIGVPTAPQPRFAHESFYLHGIDLGLVYSF